MMLELILGYLRSIRLFNTITGISTGKTDCGNAFSLSDVPTHEVIKGLTESISTAINMINTTNDYIAQSKAYNYAVNVLIQGKKIVSIYNLNENDVTIARLKELDKLVVIDYYADDLYTDIVYNAE